MARTKKIENGIKYTVVLPEEDIEKLRELANSSVISSVNSGVREAVEEYLVKIKKEDYKKELIDAVNDEEFIKRTMSSMDSYKTSDEEIEGMNTKW